MSKSLITSFILFVLLSQSQIAIGCFCITPEDSFEIADVVFRGIASIENNSIEDTDCYFCLDGLVEFKIDTFFKGGEYIRECKKVTILQGPDNCAFSFDQDSAYLVYAKYVYKYEGQLPFLTTQQCTGTNTIRREKLKIFSDLDQQSPSLEIQKNQGGHERFWKACFFASIILNLILGGLIILH